jgi:hypothetical protein
MLVALVPPTIDDFRKGGIVICAFDLAGGLGISARVCGRRVGTVVEKLTVVWSETVVYDEVVEIVMLFQRQQNKKISELPPACKTYMRYDDTPSDQHQIINANSRPLPPTINLFSNPQICTYLPTSVQENPDIISFLDPAYPTWYIRAIVEDKRNINLRCLDCILNNQEFLPQRLPRLRLSQQCALGQCLRCRNRCVYRNFLLASFDRCTGPRNRSRRRCFGCGAFLVFLNAKRELRGS